MSAAGRHRVQGHHLEGAGGDQLLVQQPAAADQGLGGCQQSKCCVKRGKGTCGTAGKSPRSTAEEANGAPRKGQVLKAHTKEC